MPRARWFAPVLLIPLLVASPAAAQTPAIIAVDDLTPTIGQTVNVTLTCPDGVGVVDGTITRTPPAPGAVTPPLFAGSTSPFTFAVTFNVDGNFTITAQCTNANSLNSPPTSLPLTVTAEQTPTTAPTTTIAPPTTGPVEPTTDRTAHDRAGRADDRRGVADECGERHD